MEPVELIKKINNATKIEDVLSISNLRDEYRALISEVHPDKCKLPGADKAAAHLNTLRDKFENGSTFTDELGDFKTNGYWVDYKSTEPCLQWSFENYRMFKALKDEASQHFSKYLPADSLILPDGIHRFILDKRAIPISGLTLPQEHVNWVFSRLLEYCAYLSQIGFVHCGLNPESVFIVPETHGIQICSFYHLTGIGKRVKTISAKYSHWYPYSLFKDKTATPGIDLELSQKIAIYLLGDPSGSGIKLKKTAHAKFLDFGIARHDDPHQTHHDYREFLKANFEKKFYPLNI